MSGLPHGVGNVTSRGSCQQFLNPTSPYPALRGLLIEGYVAAVRRAAEKLQQQRFLLAADVERYVQQAQKSDILR